jgi:capsular polysaccharide transport system permease protein
MHGILRPIDEHQHASETRGERLVAAFRRNRVFVLIVLLPTLVAAAFYYLIASDQYESEAHFVVRSSQSSPAASSGLGTLLAFGGGLSQSKSDAMSVIDYLQSTEAVLALDRRIGLVDRFRSPDADIVTRLRSADPTPEALVKYYRKQVKVTFDDERGIAEMSIRAFKPADSLLIAQQLLRMGEDRVNTLNDRSYQDALTTSSRQLNEAERALADVQVRMTRFRQVNADVDPEGSGKAQTGLVTQLTASLAGARAQLQSMRGIISPSSPQYVATAARVRALESQVAGQAGRLTGQGGTIAGRLGDYEGLRIRQEFAAKRYEAAAASYQTAREDARKKRLYLVRIVNPNMPVKSLFPERGRIVLTIFCSLLAAYAIGWLVLAGVKEHANM